MITVHPGGWLTFFLWWGPPGLGHRLPGPVSRGPLQWQGGATLSAGLQGCAGGVLHCPLPLPGAGHPAGARPHPARRLARHRLVLQQCLYSAVLLVRYITPDWARLATVRPWAEAATQVTLLHCTLLYSVPSTVKLFYSLGMSFGSLLTFASYNKFHNNCLRDALVAEGEQWRPQASNKL